MRHFSNAFPLVVVAIGLCTQDMRAQENERTPCYEFMKENGKPKFLRKYRFIELHLKDSLSSEKNITRSHIASGGLLYTTSDSITIDLREEEWWETHMIDPAEISHPVPVQWKGHRISTEDTTETLRTFALNHIDHVRYEKNLVGTGAAIAIISGIGLLIYAPLKAMKFKDGTFDGEKYIQVATPCLIGVGVGLVVMPFTEGKRRVHVKVGM